MVHGRPVISHSLLHDRFFVFCVARLPFLRSQLPGRLTLRWRLGLCLILDPSLGLGMSIEAPLAPVDGTCTGRFQKKPKKRPPANGP